MKVIKVVYNLVVSFQMVLFLLFLITNITNLDDITITFILNEETITRTFSLYNVGIAMAIVAGVVIVASLSLFSSGLNEEGTRTVAKILGFLSIATLLNIASAFYVLRFNTIGFILQTVMAIVYLFMMLDVFSQSGVANLD